MKITQVDLYEVEIPPIPPIAKYMPKIYDITLCRVQTDEGIELSLIHISEPTRPY